MAFASTLPTHPVAEPGQWLWPARQSAPWARHEGLELTLNGRGALYRALCALRASGGARSRVLLPAYHCPSVVAPVLAAGLQPMFYRVDRTLGIDWPALMARIDARTLAVLAIHYFGHRQDLTPLQAACREGVAVIEDWSHSCLGADGGLFPGDERHHRIYSLWKLLPTQQGGAWLAPRGFRSPLAPLPVLRGRQPLVLFKRLAEESLVQRGPALVSKWVQRLEHWRVARRSSGPAAPVQVPADTASMQRHGERYYPFEPAQDAVRMPWWVRRIVGACDLREVALRRLSHYAAYARALEGHAWVRPWRTTTPAAAPWVFPVLVDDRDRHDRGWRDQGVPLHTFGIYLHSALFDGQTDAVAVDDALYLADRLLCLAVHQDLTDAHVAHACAVLRAAPTPARR